jgi:predicted trehalose synthase
MMRQHAARWNVENTAASAGKGAGKGADDDDDDADGAAATARPSRRPLPSLRQLADWACALLDAQLVALALHADSHAHVRALATLVGKHVRLNEAVRKLHGYLAQILESAATPSAAAPVPEYCVEVAKW